jgi:hypothetical protein
MYRVILITLLLLSVFGCDSDFWNPGSSYSGPERHLKEAEAALKTDDADQISDLLRNYKISVYDRMRNGDSLLRTAIKHKAEKSAKILVEKRGYVDSVDLDEALKQGMTNLVKVMIEKGHAYVGVDFITSVAKSGNTDLFQWLASRPGKSYQFDTYYLPHYMKAACEGGHASLAKLLLQKGAVLTASDMQNLLRHRANIQLTTVEFIELVKKAVTDNNTDIVKTLFKLPHHLSQQQLNDLNQQFSNSDTEAKKVLIELLRVEVCINLYNDMPGFKQEWDSDDRERREKAVKNAFKALSSIHHPDRGGTKGKMQEVNRCREGLNGSL